MIYYHYTTKEAYEEINKTEEFIPSYFSMALDATYGPGWYFTDLTPDKTDKALYQLWGGIEPYRVKYYLEFDINSDWLEYCRPHVYRLPTSKIRDVNINTAGIYRDKQNNLVLTLKRMGSRLLDFFR
ncbi:MAG: hypothetical protein JRH09_15275 [Deltaproteobacteria bacterium]|nr:hypothetical protein [Deltaproteobacteria bacterium]